MATSTIGAHLGKEKGRQEMHNIHCSLETVGLTSLARPFGVLSRRGVQSDTVRGGAPRCFAPQFVSDTVPPFRRNHQTKAQCAHMRFQFLVYLAAIWSPNCGINMSDSPTSCKVIFAKSKINLFMLNGPTSNLIRLTSKLIRLTSKLIRLTSK